MRILDFFKQKGSIRGNIIPHCIPPHSKSIVSVCLFKVNAENSPLPFDGSPSADRMVDTIEIRDAGNPLDSPLSFCAEREPGFYHLQVTYIAFLNCEGERVAQLERFFPNQRPTRIDGRKETVVELKFWWPDIPVEELGLCGTFRPGQPCRPAEEVDESGSSNAGT
jgi:hypothetical protein